MLIGWNRGHGPGVNLLYQRFGDGESVVADGVLHAPITFLRGISHNSLTVFQVNYVSLGCQAQSGKKKECELESQTSEL
jgi:hypothetical protein